MRAAALVSCLLVACTPVELEARRYACDPSASREVGSGQCPGSSRCGLEGFCHEAGDVSQPWKCATASDCEMGFQCGVGVDGVSRECHDPDAGADYRCVTTADCSRGWSCGFDEARLRRCHDPASPKAWPCDSHQDCVGGWQCGLAELGGKECHDPSAPRGWKCLTDADCLGGWRCGLDDVRSGRACHDPSQPRGWQCASDLDCLGGWRCNLDGVCANPAREALEVRSAPLIDGGRVLSPLARGELELVTATVVSDLPPTTTIAFARLGQLEAFVVTPSSVVHYQLGVAAGTSALVAQGPQSTRFLGAGSGFENGTDTFVYAAQADGGVRTFQLLHDGGVRSGWLTSQGTLADPTPITQFRTGLSDVRSSLPPIIGFSPSVPDSLSFLTGPDDFSPSGSTPFPPGTVLRDVAHATVPNPVDLVPTKCTFLVNDRGLWVTDDRALSRDFVPVHDPTLFGNRFCNGGSALTVSRFELLRTNRAVVTAEPSDGGAPNVSIWDLSDIYADHGGYRCSASSMAAACSTEAFAISTVLGPCAPCPRGRLLEAAGVEGVNGLEVQTLCGEPDGGASLFYRVAAGCAVSAMTGASSVLFANVRPATHHAGGLAYASRDGRLWRGPSAVSSIGLVLDQVPTAVSRRALDEIVFFAPGSLGVFQAGVGIASVPQTGTIVGARNWPQWVLSNELLVDLGGAVGGPESGLLLAQAQGTLAEPRQLVRALGPRGQPLAVVGAGRQLWSAELSTGAVAPAVLAPRLGLADDVQSLAMAPPADAGVFAEGYAVAGSTVAHLLATNAVQWSTELVPLPRSSTPKAVWFDGARARLGLTNGAVLSLPGRVPLAPPLDGATVEDFLSTCRQDFALTSTGLHALVVRPPLLMGEWVPVPLPTEFAPTTGLGSGRLFAVGSSLFVVSRSGDVAEMTLGGCP